MNRWRFLLLLGFLKPRKTEPVASGDHLVDADGISITDVDGNKLIG